jgi:hypothetical protein
MPTGNAWHFLPDRRQSGGDIIRSERLEPSSIARMDVEFPGTGGGDAQRIERQFLRRQGNSRVVFAGARPIETGLQHGNSRVEPVIPVTA